MTIKHATFTSNIASPTKEYWRVKELAALFEVTPKTIWCWIKNNPDFPKVALKPSHKCSLIRNSDLQRYLSMNKTEYGEA